MFKVGAALATIALVVSSQDLTLDYETAERLAALPLTCYNQEFPHKYGVIFQNESEVANPSELHPIFYGCFDWHSSVHGHWLLASFLNRFPGTPLADQIVALFNEQFTTAKVALEVAHFSRDKNFERPYGWTWFLKLQQELLNNPLDSANGWSSTLQPLVDVVVQGYKGYLPKLLYPLREGTHSNTAFGLIFAYEYAKYVNESSLSELISFNASAHYSTDINCPLSWEPSGHDFLSPCLQEADLQGRLTPPEDEAGFATWLQEFQPQLFDEAFRLEPGQVIDRTDGHLVHLDGLNFSRGWNLYSLILRMPASLDSHRQRWFDMADEHLRTSYDFVVGSDYAGSHWLASFLVYALQMRELAENALKQ